MKKKFNTLIFFCLLTVIINAQKKPNVIIIYTDDQATLDVNILGAKDLVSPNMDKLMLSGTTFTQFYASPVCSPSRASLLTGKNPQRAGVHSTYDSNVTVR